MLIQGSTPVAAGIRLLPAVCCLVPGSVVVAGLTTRLGRYRWAIWAGWIITTNACGLFILFDLHTNLAVFSTALVLFGLGNGMVLTGVNIGIQAISQDEDSAMAASMYGFLRSLGMPLGVAVSTSYRCSGRYISCADCSSYREQSCKTQCLKSYETLRTTQESTSPSSRLYQMQIQ
jgi:fucose permease